MTSRKSSIWGVWAAPGGRETFQKGGGLRPPPFCRVSRPPGAAQTPKIDDRSKNHRLKTQVYAGRSWDHCSVGLGPLEEPPRNPGAGDSGTEAGRFRTSGAQKCKKVLFQDFWSGNCAAGQVSGHCSGGYVSAKIGPPSGLRPDGGPILVHTRQKSGRKPVRQRSYQTRSLKIRFCAPLGAGYLKAVWLEFSFVTRWP